MDLNSKIDSSFHSQYLEKKFDAMKEEDQTSARLDSLNKFAQKFDIVHRKLPHHSDQLFKLFYYFLIHHQAIDFSAVTQEDPSIIELLELKMSKIKY
ncbi:hypothetical protein TRFO_26220 [Tritrichomonas foetus]|uniref:Uncharacterized protein n=1 Tax=Tritrichomonas foetus TaxID=1144522 RepID=A0A1J4K4T8_9EUKA|nr:hypothetical protein TRFO_26220 [Tritrichomonas foetus]|eukprot:OHT05872.1 hypothetical protein TRFO_26220 [Tritrichomonas foetus]